MLASWSCASPGQVALAAACINPPGEHLFSSGPSISFPFIRPFLFLAHECSVGCVEVSGLGSSEHPLSPGCSGLLGACRSRSQCRLRADPRLPGPRRSRPGSVAQLRRRQSAITVRTVCRCSAHQDQNYFLSVIFWSLNARQSGVGLQTVREWNCR